MSNINSLPSRHDVVDQAVLGRQHGGMAIITASFDNKQGMRDIWHRKLRQHARLLPLGQRPVPDETFSYLVFPDGAAAVLRRVNAGYSAGRNFSTALIGSERELSALSLALCTWPGWQDAASEGDGDLAPVPLGDLARLVDSASMTFDDHFRHRDDDSLQSMLVALLAAVLDRPWERISVIGVPDGDRAALVWALRQIAEPVFDGSDQPQRWTFSTYENSDAADIDDLPDVVFLPAIPEDGRPVERRSRLDVSAPLPQQPQADLAATLVRRYLPGSADLRQQVTDLLAGAPKAIGERIDLLRAKFLDRLSVLESVATIHTGRHEAEAERGLFTAFSSVEPLDRDEPKAGHKPGMAETGAVADLVRLAAGSRGPQQLQRHLSSIGDLGLRSGGPGRHAMRAALGEHAYLDVPIRRCLPGHEQENAFAELAELAFGPGLADLSQPDVQQQVAGQLYRSEIPAMPLAAIVRRVEVTDPRLLMLLGVGRRADLAIPFAEPDWQCFFTEGDPVPPPAMPVPVQPVQPVAEPLVQPLPPPVVAKYVVPRHTSHIAERAERLQRQWSEAAKRYGQRLLTFRVTALVMFVFGATAATGTVWLSILLPTEAQALAVAAALLFCGGAVTLVVTGQRQTGGWLLMRQVSETIAGELYAFLLGVYPYHDGKADQQLDRRVVNVMEAAHDLYDRVQKVVVPRSRAPQVTDLNSYVDARVLTVLQRRKGESGTLRVVMIAANILAILLGVSAAVLVLLFDAGWASFVGTGAIAVMAFAAAARWEPRLLEVRRTINGLESLLAVLPQDEPMSEALRHRFVTDCERVIAGETGAPEATGHRRAEGGRQ